MSYIETDPISSFDSVFDSGFQEDFVGVILNAYETSFKHCIEQFTKHHALYHLPFYRYALINSELSKMHSRYPLFDISVEDNGNISSSHTLIRKGCISLTVHSVHDLCEIVRWAKYRESYCRNNDEMLFDIYPEPSDDAILHCFIIHGYDKGYLNKPAFIDVVFPVFDGSCYHPDRIKLLNRFTKIQTTHDQYSIEEISEVKPILKPILKKGENVA